MILALLCFSFPDARLCFALILFSRSVTKRKTVPTGVDFGRSDKMP